MRRIINPTSVSLFLALLLWAPLALGVLPPEAYQAARDAAQAHVQVTVTEVEVPGTTPGECRVQGEVAHVFWDHTSQLEVGTPVSFLVSCSREGDAIPAGPVLWQNVDALGAAEVLDVHLNQEGEDFQVALWQTEIVPEIGFEIAPLVPPPAEAPESAPATE
jgi:hypothetical protein